MLGEAPGRDWLAPRGEAIDLVLEDGLPRFEEPPTVIAVSGEEWSVQSEGVYDAAELRRLTACLVLFVCTGNTCRSPMAEALCKELLADRLGCAVEELPAPRLSGDVGRGWRPIGGDAAAAEAVGRGGRLGRTWAAIAAGR